MIKSLLRLIISLTLAGCGLLVPSTQAHAISSDDQYCTLGDGGCTFFLQDDCDSTAGADTTNVTLTGNDNIEKAFNFFVQNLHLTAIQSAAIVGNFMQESSLDPTAVNPDGGAYGIAQWGGDRLSGLQTFADQQGTDQSDFTTQLLYVQYELTTTRTGDLSDLKQTSDIVTATRTFENDYEKAGDTPDSPGVEIVNRIAYAKEILAKYGGDAAATAAPAAGTTTGANADCDSTATLTSAYGSQIVATALGLVWPTPNCVQNALGQHRSSCQQATQAYDQAYDGGGGGETDCGAFVGTVMHVSKADPDYPAASTEAQAGYVEGNPTKYSISHAASTAQLQPGDILIFPGEGGDSGHTEIYVGKQPGGYVTADASLGDHTPQLNTAGDVAWILAQPGAFVAVPAAANPSAAVD